jgi:hypothetical protein
MRRIQSQHPPQMPLAEDQNMIQALAPLWYALETDWLAEDAVSCSGAATIDSLRSTSALKRCEKIRQR